VRLRYDLPGAGHSGGDAFGNAQVQILGAPLIFCFVESAA
jgi:hypothetical protein